LTFAGEQLRAAWTEKLLGGRLGYTLRPWLDARMPAFPARARIIAHGLALAHGVAVEDDARGTTADEASAQLGKQLLGTVNGFSCITCHAVGDEPAQMPQHFGVVNLQQARERLREEFYLRWTLNPQRLTPLTPMPAYADEDGSTPLVQVLGGDARLQFQAIWSYLETVK
jgi:mono/diheme cytochrome c family protein